MMTAIDTNVLLDVLSEGSAFAEVSAAELSAAYDRGGLCISPVVFAELSPHFESRKLIDSCLLELGIVVVCDEADTAWLAGQSWAAYRRQGGARARILADFLIGAHATVYADALLTRDRGFYRQCFPRLRVIEPGTVL